LIPKVSRVKVGERAGYRGRLVAVRQALACTGTVVAAAAIAAAALSAGPTATAAEPSVSLGIVFPEGFSVRQMADRIATGWDSRARNR
jgi:hypothetical protein